MLLFINHPSTPVNYSKVYGLEALWYVLFVQAKIPRDEENAVC